jgi:NAD(P)-dependent dehydrogenase (short-subunit alcohol dehydrogenase family)
VNVNAIEPGYMATELTEGLWENEWRRQLLAGFPRGRIMDVNALDPLLLYLCSDASAPVAGSVLTIDDGADPVTPNTRGYYAKIHG